jgi:hypothetical protein
MRHLWRGARAFVDGADVHIAEARAMVRDLLHEVDRLYNQMLANASPMALREVERAAIVKWLRTNSEAIERFPWVADDIERGEHLK